MFGGGRPGLGPLPNLSGLDADEKFRVKRLKRWKGIKDIEKKLYSEMDPEETTPLLPWYIVDGSNLFFNAERPEHSDPKVKADVDKTRSTVANVAYEVRSKGGGPGHLVIILKPESYDNAFGDVDESKRWMTRKQSRTRHLNLLRPLMNDKSKIFLIVAGVPKCKDGPRGPCLEQYRNPAQRPRQLCSLKPGVFGPDRTNRDHLFCEYDDWYLSTLYLEYVQNGFGPYRKYLDEELHVERDPRYLQSFAPSVCPTGPDRVPVQVVPRPGTAPQTPCPQTLPNGVMFVSNEQNVMMTKSKMNLLQATYETELGDAVETTLYRLYWNPRQLGF